MWNFFYFVYFCLLFSRKFSSHDLPEWICIIVYCVCKIWCAGVHLTNLIATKISWHAWTRNLKQVIIMIMRHMVRMTFIISICNPRSLDDLGPNEHLKEAILCDYVMQREKVEEMRTHLPWDGKWNTLTWTVSQVASSLERDRSKLLFASFLSGWQYKMRIWSGQASNQVKIYSDRKCQAHDSPRLQCNAQSCDYDVQAAIIVLP